MDNEMIERVAIAIKEAQWGNSVAWKDCADEFKNTKLEQAVAAIRAMREPTENMCYGGDASAGNANRAKAVWQDMIDCIIE